MRSLVSLFVIVLTSLSVSGQTGSVTRYSLADCIRIGLQNNFDLIQANASSRAAAAGLTQAFGQYLPSASMSANYSRQLTNLRPQVSFVNGVPLAGQPIPNRYSANINLGWTLFNGFRREADFDRSNNDMDAVEHDISFQRLNVSYNITRQYIDVLRTSQLVTARKENLSLSRATYDRVKALYENGRAPLTQLLSQETEVLNQETSVVTAENDHDLAKVTLLTTMCIDPTQQVLVDEASLPNDATTQEMDGFRTMIGDEHASVDRAIETRPDLKAAFEREESAESGITSATAGYFPTIRVNGGYGWQNFEISNFDSQGQWFVGLNLQVPIFDQFQTNLNIENAKFSRIQADLNTRRLRQQIEQNVRRAYLQLAAAEKGLQISNRALVSAKTSFDAMQERFNVGGAQLVEVQQANFQFITARINRVTAVYAYLDARTYVEFATGLFGEP